MKHVLYGIRNRSEPDPHTNLEFEDLALQSLGGMSAAFGGVVLTSPLDIVKTRMFTHTHTNTLVITTYILTGLVCMWFFRTSNHCNAYAISITSFILCHYPHYDNHHHHNHHPHPISPSPPDHHLHHHLHLHVSILT